MKQQLVTHAEILALWPRVSDLANDLNVPYGRAHKWKQRGYIAPVYWDELILLVAQRFGVSITLQQLTRGASIIRGKKKPAAAVREKKRAA